MARSGTKLAFPGHLLNVGILREQTFEACSSTGPQPTIRPPFAGTNRLIETALTFMYGGAVLLPMECTLYWFGGRSYPVRDDAAVAAVANIQRLQIAHLK